MNSIKTIILRSFAMLLLLGGLCLLMIDHQLHRGIGKRVETELKWLAEFAVETIAIANVTLKTKQIDPIAKRLKKISGARFTFINDHGWVIGDSDVAFNQVVSMANHIERSEMQQALQSGHGSARRHSETLHHDFFYVAILKTIEINGRPVDLFARVSFSAETISAQIMDMRLTLLVISTFGVVTLTIIIVIAMRRMARAKEREQQILKSKLDQQDSEIEAMQELDSLLGACIELDDANKVINQLLPNLLDQSSGAISVYKSSRDALVTNIFWGRPWLADTEFSPNQCWALRKGHEHLFNGGAKGVACEHFSQDQALNQSSLCVPLIAHGETVGVMHIHQQQFSDQLITLINSVAKRIGIAIANVQLKHSLRQQAIRDSLTNLYNRRYLFETLEQLVARSLRANSPIGIIMIDIDHFKKLNDSYGHDAGDIALKTAADFFVKGTRAGDVVCRYGGEEFCIVCPDSSIEQTVLIAQKICTGVAGLEIKINHNEKITMTLSAGVSAFVDEENMIHGVISQADQALYQAKSDGRNCVRAFKLI